MAWRANKRVGLGTREYRESTRWVRIAAPGYTLFVDPPTPDVAQPPTGLGMAATDLEELSSLVNGKTAVTITD